MVELAKVLFQISETGSTWVKVEDQKTKDRDLVFRQTDDGTYATHKFFQTAEEKIARLTYARIRTLPVPKEKVESLIRQYETKNHIVLDIQQKKAVFMMVSEKICILTGGPGTGKTSVLKAAFFVLKNLFPASTTAFTAPTGKAARRITESAGFEASTIQKKIGDTGGNSLIQVLEDFLFIDEVSMLDVETMQKILCALSYRTRLILIGDVDQLPSVEPGAVLRDLVDCGLIPTINLTKTFRQDNESELFTNIQIVRNGMEKKLIEGKEFIILQKKDAFKVAAGRYLGNLKEFGKENVILLSPYRDGGTVNSYNFNNFFQSRLNKAPGVKILQERNNETKEIEFRVNDPVIQLRNRDDIANGDVGRVIYARNGEVKVRYDDDTVFSYQGEELEDLDLAYAMSVNKSQGSEYDCVVIPLLREHTNINRNLIYTAITRAKKKVEIVTDDYSFIQEACKIQAAWERKTFLAEEMAVAEKRCELLGQII